MTTPRFGGAPLGLACGALLALAAVFTFPRPGAAQGQTRADEPRLEALSGARVVIFFMEPPTSAGKGEISELVGKVASVTTHGLWLDSELRLFAKKQEPYAGELYVPFTAVAYLKKLPPE